MSKEQTDLLPCPLCNVALTRDGKSPLGDIWSHPLNGCAMQVSWFTATPEWVEKWNRRAPPSPAGGVQGVKALNWHAHEWEEPVTRYSCVQLGLAYFIDAQPEGWKATVHYWGCGDARNVGQGSYPNIDKAKAAAQADYEARILSALSSQAQTTGGVE